MPDPYSDTACVHQLVERQVARTPAHTAVVFGERALSYAELNAQANQLAHFLSARGAGPDVVIGLYMGRSIEQMIALFAVLKTGAAYVPLDPQYPKDRLDHMVLDSAAKYLLVLESATERGRTGGEELLFASDPRARAWAGEPTTDLRVPGLTPDHLAHLLYTSGSTGRPKGVEIPHRAVVNFLESMQSILGFTGDQVLLSVTGLTFDIAGLDHYLSWMTGATLVLVPRPVVLDGALLKGALEDSGATFLQTTPVTWRGLIDAGWAAPAGFKAICGGELLPRQLLEDFSRQIFRIWNMYGPTETTIWSTACELTPAEYARGGRISVGRAIANTTLNLVDDALAPVPAGSVGEVCIGGVGLARGYHNQPELTADRFVPIPWQPSSRMYRTGDLGLFRPDGELELLGRKDHQIKFHGYRIEPGEIEFAIRQSTGDVESVVVLREVGGKGELVAFVAAPRESVADLPARLTSRLPAYMVPGYIVPLPRLPQTHNGKVDRNALPAPAPGDRRSP